MSALYGAFKAFSLIGTALILLQPDASQLGIWAVFATSSPRW